MSDSGASAVEIYIGNPVEHESERSTLQVIGRVLAADNCPAVVFANFSVLSRQIDILVARDGLTLVIEAKSRTRAVRGCENGPWQVHAGTGGWKDFPNPYHQALDAAFAIKDAMRAFFDGHVPYVAAALVFAPEIPRGSQTLQGDRKVSVMGHDRLRERLRRRGRNVWSGDRWREFGRHLGLTRVSSIAAACNPILVEAECRIREYAASFLPRIPGCGAPGSVWLQIGRGQYFVFGCDGSCIGTPRWTPASRSYGVRKVNAGRIVRHSACPARWCGCHHTEQGV